ncbi:MAG: hypothetical protein JJE45_00225 [Prolixibacteraceae bacterium]|nr:hypothetical protein [Prolixibacteraceae bacterium]
MKTKTINLYQFSELSDKAKENAINKLSDINVDSDWFESTYEDAENINFKITGFDIDRASYVNGNFMISAADTAELIKVSHGNECETFDTAKEFLTSLNELTSTKENIEDVPEEEIEEIEDEFLKSLCEDYRIILTKEYEYGTSEEAITDTIEANEYYFTEDSTLK